MSAVALLLEPLVLLAAGVALGALAVRWLGSGLERSVRQALTPALLRLEGSLDERREQAAVLLLVALGDPALAWTYERGVGRPFGRAAEGLLDRGADALLAPAPDDDGRGRDPENDPGTGGER